MSICPNKCTQSANSMVKCIKCGSVYCKRCGTPFPPPKHSIRRCIVCGASSENIKQLESISTSKHGKNSEESQNSKKHDNRVRKIDGEAGGFTTRSKLNDANNGFDAGSYEIFHVPGMNLTLDNINARKADIENLNSEEDAKRYLIHNGMKDEISTGEWIHVIGKYSWIPGVESDNIRFAQRAMMYGKRLYSGAMISRVAGIIVIIASLCLGFLVNKIDAKIVDFISPTYLLILGFAMLYVWGASRMISAYSYKVASSFAIRNKVTILNYLNSNRAHRLSSTQQFITKLAHYIFALALMEEKQRFVLTAILLAPLGVAVYFWYQLSFFYYVGIVAAIAFLVAFLFRYAVLNPFLSLFLKFVHRAD